MSAEPQYSQNKMVEVYETAATFNNPNRKRTEDLITLNSAINRWACFQLLMIQTVTV